MAPPPPGLDSAGTYEQDLRTEPVIFTAVGSEVFVVTSVASDGHQPSGDSGATTITTTEPLNDDNNYDTSNTHNTTAADEPQETYSLLDHPAIVFASDRLSDPAYTARFRSLAVFDFDQTLFQSPLPNPALWDPAFIGVLTTWNYCGTGWWHNPGTLELGPAVEESVWDGWWNEHVVERVVQCEQDPECLTILLTGRNGPTFGTKLVQMIEAKGLNFDIIATKPTTVAKLEPDTVLKGYSRLPVSRSSNTSRCTKQPQNGTKDNSSQHGHHHRTEQERHEYLKIHTFNAKHDFLYNVLYEYPSIRAMTLWDDRPCQISKFRQAGEKWLDQRLLDHFHIHVVQEPLQYLDPQREYNLVMAMVEENNRQVDIEANGGPFLVPGIGPILRTRPELEGVGLWDPYETYRPTPRERIEVGKVTRYTGVMFSEPIKQFLANQGGRRAADTPDTNADKVWIQRPEAIRDKDLRKWVVPDDSHVTLCMGAAHANHLKQLGGLGATVFVELVAKGSFEGRIWALKIKEYEIPPAYLSTTASNGSTPGHPTPLPVTDDHNDDDDDVLVVAPTGEMYDGFAAFWKAHYTPLPPKNHRTSVDGDAPVLVRRRSTMRVWTVDLSKVDLERIGHVVLSRPETTPHITMAYDRLNGTRAVESGKITDWEPIFPDDGDGNGDSTATKRKRRIVLVGTIGEKKLVGLKSTKHGQAATTPRAEVSIAKMLMAICPEKVLPGPRLGELVKRVKEQMDKQQVANLSENQAKIEAIARDIWDKDEVMAQMRGGEVEGKDEVQAPA